MNKLDNLILEAYKEVLNEMPKGATLKVKDIPQAMIDRLEKQYGPVDKRDDFFSKNMDTYFKFTGRNKTTGSVEHKIIKLPSFFNCFFNLLSNAFSCIFFTIASCSNGMTSFCNFALSPRFFNLSISISSV